MNKTEKMVSNLDRLLETMCRVVSQQTFFNAYGGGTPKEMLLLMLGVVFSRNQLQSNSNVHVFSGSIGAQYFRVEACFHGYGRQVTVNITNFDKCATGQGHNMRLSEADMVEGVVDERLVNVVWVKILESVISQSVL